MSTKKISGYIIHMDSPLGHGAYGSVYKGQKDNGSVQCAIKIIEKKLITKDEYLKSAFDSEVQIMGKLKSSNIVSLFDVLQSSHNYYIVQELCQTDLEHYLKEQKGQKISEEKAIEFLTQICNGFMTLVKQGVVHRDLKPANILMSKGELKIADFGFAKANIHKKIKNQTCVGTPLYMSLQVLKSQGYTSKCDIWSIGCIFYQMLHGHTPWTAKSQYELVQAILNKPLVINPKLDHKTKNFLTKTLQIRQADRICWDDLFRHKIFNGYFEHYIDENQEFENKYKKVMSDIRFKVNSENLDLEEIWQQLGFGYNEDIKFSQFQQFLQEISPDIEKSQQIYFFEKLDPEGKGTINLAYFSQELEKHQICMKSRHKLGIRKINTLSQYAFEELDLNSTLASSAGWDEEFDIRVSNCFRKLHKIIKSKGLTLYNTYMIHNKDNNQGLNISQFSKIFKRLDNSLTPDQLQIIFNQLDDDGESLVKFHHLNSYYCKINNIPQQSQYLKNSLRSTTPRDDKENPWV